MAFQQVLCDGRSMASGTQLRLLPGLNISRWDRLHFHISGGVRAIPNMSVRILFGTPHDGKILLSDSTIWFEDTVSERNFSYTSVGGSTGFIMSVPVVAPLLYDVILNNNGDSDFPEVYVTVMAQEI